MQLDFWGNFFLTSLPSQVDFMGEIFKSRNVVLVPFHRWPNAIYLAVTPCSLLHYVPQSDQDLQTKS